MKTKTSEFTPIVPQTARRDRGAVPHHMSSPRTHAAPAAIDEIFAHLAERQAQVERANESPLDAKRIRETATEMDRQRERLAQLLRDIDLSA
jgi:hypothetical protein